jgi:hypothetical protein
MSEELKRHLRQDHGVHEAPIEVTLTEDELSYRPGMPTDKLEQLHRQHHRDDFGLLSHSHPEFGHE